MYPKLPTYIYSLVNNWYIGKPLTCLSLQRMKITRHRFHHYIIQTSFDVLKLVISTSFIIWMSIDNPNTDTVKPALSDQLQFFPTMLKLQCFTPTVLTKSHGTAKHWWMFGVAVLVLSFEMSSLWPLCVPMSSVENVC